MSFANLLMFHVPVFHLLCLAGQVPRRLSWIWAALQTIEQVVVNPFIYFTTPTLT